jgi:hypothetical protein
MSRVTLWSWGGIAALAVVLGVVSWVAWPPAVAPDAPRAREYRDFDVCVLTDSDGVRGGPAAVTWAGLQAVSERTRTRLSRLPVSGEQTEARARQYVATQVQQQCAIVVAVGAVQAAAVDSVAAIYPKVTFLTVTSDAEAEAVAGKVSQLIPAE